MDFIAQLFTINITVEKNEKILYTTQGVWKGPESTSFRNLRSGAETFQFFNERIE